MEIHNSPILWIIMGIVLLALEILTFTFILFFFGMAALIVGGLKYLGLNNLPVEIFIFSILGLSTVLVFRKKVSCSLKNKGGTMGDKGNRILLDEKIMPHETTEVSYQGSKWIALNDSDLPILKGENAEIIRTEGIKLIVQPVSQKIDSK